jgi:hypothetical protein
MRSAMLSPILSGRTGPFLPLSYPRRGTLRSHTWLRHTLQRHEAWTGKEVRRCVTGLQDGQTPSGGQAPMKDMNTDHISSRFAFQ